MAFIMQFDERQIATVLTTCIKDNIGQLGIQLHFNATQIQNFQEQNRKSSNHQGTLQMLNEWKQMAKDDQIPTMRNALLASGLAAVEEEVMSKMQFTQEQIDELTQAIDDNPQFNELCNKLGFDAATAIGYKGQNIDKNYEGTRQMLRDWQAKTKEKQIPTLKTALQESGMDDIAKKL